MLLILYNNHSTDGKRPKKERRDEVDTFEKIYVSYKQDIYRFLLKMTNYNSGLSEELLSETFFQAFLSFDRFRGECEVKTWLCRIAKNTYSGYIRKEIYKERLYERMKTDSGHYRGSFGREEVSRQAEDRELLSCIQAILKDCGSKERDIVLYRMYAGLKFQEIAKILGIKEATAKVVFYRTKIEIQKQLKERFGYEI